MRDKGRNQCKLIENLKQELIVKLLKFFKMRVERKTRRFVERPQSSSVV